MKSMLEDLEYMYTAYITKGRDDKYIDYIKEYLDKLVKAGTMLSYNINTDKNLVILRFSVITGSDEIYWYDEETEHFSYLCTMNEMINLLREN